jgi:F5/8 type C domain/PA14 domain
MRRGGFVRAPPSGIENAPNLRLDLANTYGGIHMKPVPIAVVGLVALAGCSREIESPSDRTQVGATSNSRLKRILIAAVACFALGSTSAQAQDMALNKPASASSTENNRTDLRPALGNDGNSSTRWSSSFVDNQWWQVDLGSISQLDRVELNWETAYASRYRIQTRTSTLDSWSTAATATISSPGLRVHTFPVRNARYVRIQGDQRATGWGISLWDVRVFGPTSSPPAPDGDGDGVPDSTDQCPTQPGPASNGGCPSSADCPTGQYLARYWSNQTLSGLPVLSRCEALINNDFGTGSPAGVPADGFSARYEGTVNFDAGDYEFALGGDDGVRLYIDGVRVIDRWVDQAFTTYRHTQTMAAGRHTVRVEFYENRGLARVDLDFAKLTQAPLTGFPNTFNTGVPPGTALEPHNGNLTVNTAGAVISNRLINGCVTVNAANVTIRRSKIVCNGPSAIWSGSTGLLVEDTEVDCNNAAGRTAITPQGYTARRVNAHSCDNILWASRNVLIEDSYIHDPIPCCGPTQPHTDAIQVPAGGSNIRVEHNTVYGGYLSQANFGNAAISASASPGTSVTNVVVNNNVLAGGGYTLYCPGADGGFTWTNNRFSRVFVSTVGGFGPLYFTCEQHTHSGNVYHETGSPL